MKRENVALTKVTRPRLQLTYHRSDLYVLLDELSATPLLLINGLPGSGKSTLISGYVDSRNIPCLWYQIDRDDEDLTTFFYYLGIAAHKINPYNKIALPHVSPERSFDVHFQAKVYFQRLYQYLETPFMIVLDNYHELPEDALLRDVIGEACAEIPAGGRIILINNGDRRVNLPVMRSHRTIATLGGEDLQLSPDEVKEIAALHGVTLPSDQAAKQLLGKVGGWVAGVVQELHKERPSLNDAAEALTF